MPTLKTIDLYAAVGEGVLTDSTGRELKGNAFPVEPIMGETVLIRWTLFEAVNGTTAFAIADGDGLEFIVSDRRNASESDILAYAHTRDFIAGDWSEFDRSAGKVSARVSFNTEKLRTKFGSSARVSDLICELVIVPAGTCNHVTAHQTTMAARNEVYPSAAELDTIDLFPPCESSSESESSSSGGSSASSASSTSESSANTSSSQSSTSESSTSESSERSSLSSSSSSSSTVAGNTSSSSSSTDSSSNSSSTSTDSSSSQSSLSSSSSSTHALPSSQSSTSESSANSSSSSPSSSQSSTSEST